MSINELKVQDIWIILKNDRNNVLPHCHTNHIHLIIFILGTQCNLLHKCCSRTCLLLPVLLVTLLQSSKFARSPVPQHQLFVSSTRYQMLCVQNDHSGDILPVLQQELIYYPWPVSECNPDLFISITCQDEIFSDNHISQ